MGIGGLFFRARDPDALSAWYRDHLGIGAGCAAPDTAEPNEWVWHVQGGPVVFAPFQETTEYFAADKQWMLNLRVSDLDGLLARLGEAEIAIETRAEWNAPETGRFARIHDPDGNAIELWEPPA
jgi:predicted enzyme related to lactoylglutathione lyase